MRVEKITHGGKVRVVVVQGLESYPEGLVMAPWTFELLRGPLERKYGPPVEVVREATPEEAVMAAAVGKVMHGPGAMRGNGAGGSYL